MDPNPEAPPPSPTEPATALPVIITNDAEGWRIWLGEFPDVCGVGDSEAEALEDFLDEFEDWGADEPAVFEQWFKKNRPSLEQQLPPL